MNPPSIQLSHVEIQMAVAVGKMRTKSHENAKSTFTMVKDNDYLGAAGEIAFADFMDVDWDWRNKKYGDGGIDFTIHGITIDVKCTRGNHQTRRLMVAQGDVNANLYVHTVHHSTTPGLIHLIGWEWGHIIRRIQPVKPPGFYKFNHITEPGDLNSMHYLDVNLEEHEITPPE